MTSETIDIFARWSHWIENKNPTHIIDFTPKTHVYAVEIPPPLPLAVGMSIRIFAISPAQFYAPKADDDLLAAYDAHVVGKIVARVAALERRVVMEVVNECGANTVRVVWLEVPYVPGVMVEEWEGVGAGRSLREAHESDLLTGMRILLPPARWGCKVRECAVRPMITAGDGGVEIFRMAREMQRR
ncbi:hypothetical protein C8Q76DRAFT_697840 [Earliella scabrosa]|nr:hypothetical protein C8Q76DRAFT_697840 [Earliella scabrosa]